MAEDDPSERVRRLASPRVRGSFSSRLHTYSGTLTPIPPSMRPRYLVLSPFFELHRPIRRKSHELIRAMLERIQRLVRGELSV
jgi:hypothetical protein